MVAVIFIAGLLATMKRISNHQVTNHRMVEFPAMIFGLIPSFVACLYYFDSVLNPWLTFTVAFIVALEFSAIVALILSWLDTPRRPRSHTPSTPAVATLVRPVTDNSDRIPNHRDLIAEA